MRRLNGWGWTHLVNLVFGHAADDVDCAFKLMTREVVESLPVQSRGAMFSAELLVRARRAGVVFREVGVTHLPRTKGTASGAGRRCVSGASRVLLGVWKGLRLPPRAAKPPRAAPGAKRGH